MPAQLVVTSAADDGGVGTLRSVLADANTNGEADTITFDNSVTTITLVTGQLAISENQNLRIDGGGKVSINGADTPSATNRLLDITALDQPTVTIENITLAKGNVASASGGAIRLTNQTLHFLNVAFNNNTSTQSGGAISLENGGKLIVDDCQFVGNTAAVRGGAVSAGSKAASITINHSVFSNNSGARYGGAVYSTGASLISVTKSHFESNSAGIFGGGAFYVDGNATVTIQGTTIAHNSTTTTVGAYGGGINFQDVTFDIHESLFVNNSSLSYGGGLEADDSSGTLANCTFAGNSAFAGGGGIDIYGDSTVALINCTIANNTAYRGGGINVGLNADLTMRNSTIAGNAATGFGGAGGVQMDDAASIILIDSSIVAANKSASGRRDANSLGAPTIFGSNNLFGSLEGVTLIGDNDPALIGTEKLPVDPGLLPLGNYGGPTLTMGLKSSSIAINKGSNPLGLLFDQRGQPREVPTGFPDIGAFEGTVAPAQIEFIEINDGDSQRSQVTSITVNFDLPIALPTSPADAFQLKRQSDDAIVATNAVVDGNSVKLSFTSGPVEFGSLADGRYTLTVFASNVTGGYFDGNGDGIAGDNYVFVGTPANGLFRLFGDADGNGVVAAGDFNAFRLAYGTTGPSIFDFNGDGQVSASDFNQFRLRYGVMV